MNSSLFRRLRLKFIIISMSLLLLFLGAVCITVYVAMAHALTQRSEAALDFTAELIRTDDYVKSGAANPPVADAVPPLVPNIFSPQDQNEILRQSWALRHGDVQLDTMLVENVIVFYSNQDGVIQRVMKNGLTSNDHQAAVGSKLETYLHSKIGDAGTVKLSGSSYRYKQYEIEDQSVFLMVSCESDVVSTNQLMVILGSIGLVSILLLLCLCYYLSGKAIKPLSQSWQQQKQFLHDASHELKTPLAVIATNIDAIRGCPDDTIAQQDKWLGYIADETRDMRNLVNDMLTLAKGEEPSRNDRVMVTFSLSDTVNEAGLLMEANALDVGIMLDTVVEEGIDFIGNPDDIKHLLLILLDNALKNTFEGGRIDLALSRSHNDLLITCRNTGRGIPASELQNIFRRFYRVDPSRARESGGSGLGLSIAERIVKSYNGKIWAESEEGEYALFCVKLPALKD